MLSIQLANEMEIASEYSGGLMANRGKILARSAFMAVFFGMLGLFNVMRNSRFQEIHTVDTLQLIASGMCFGVALAALFGIIRGSRES